MALLTRSYLLQKVSAASGLIYESNIRSFAATALANEKQAQETRQSFDIFLSHSIEDAILVKALKDVLVDAGYTVYVDWIEDPQLNRGSVSKETARILRGRMQQCRCLLFATSDASKKSVWMPWELGYMDAKTDSRVAIVPIVRESEKDGDFIGQEYLGLYPYFDKTGETLYIHRSRNNYIGFARWLDGGDI